MVPSPEDARWGRTQLTGSGVEEVDRGKRGITGEKRGGLVRTKRAVVRTECRPPPLAVSYDRDKNRRPGGGQILRYNHHVSR